MHFVVRGRAGITTATTFSGVNGARTATARLDSTGTLTLKVDDQPAVTATQRVSITAMPVDGLDVGSDEGGAVGPYSAPNKFAGTIESITIELDAK